MTPSDDLSPPRRPIFFPVVIATVFLTIIGMTGGFVLGERKRHEIAEPSPTTTTESASPTVSYSGPLCPPETLAIAEELQLPTELHQVLKIQTDNGTTVWICQDPGGNFYYQGKTGGLDAPLQQRKNGLFLPNAQPRGGDEYLAVAPDGNRFIVNRKRLEVRRTSGDTQINKVVSVE